LHERFSYLTTLIFCKKFSCCSIQVRSKNCQCTSHA